MKYLLQVIVPMILVSCSTAEKNTVVITDQDEIVLRELKTVLWSKAYDEQDTVLLNQLLHEDFRLVDDNGDLFTKQDELEYVARYGASYDEFNYEIIRSDIFDNGTAVILGIGTMKGVEGEETYITKYTSSDVFVKVGNQWKAINSHVSGVKEKRYSIF